MNPKIPTSRLAYWQHPYLKDTGFEFPSRSFPVYQSPYHSTAYNLCPDTAVKESHRGSKRTLLLMTFVITTQLRLVREVRAERLQAVSVDRVQL
jgi:hypothetical protein